MDWDAVSERANALSARHPAAVDLLRFYSALTRFQKDIYHRARSQARPDPRRLDTELLTSFVPSFLQLAEKYGPPEMAALAQRAQDRQDWEPILRSCWRQTRERLEPLARAILQPYVVYLAERWQVEVGLYEPETNSCPFCARPPLVGVLNGRRRLVCSLCSTEWAYPEGQCPGCHVRKLTVLRHRSFPHVRVRACESCGHYLKEVDLAKDRAAVGVVDEVASLELDALARDKGYSKLEHNLVGL